jgi:hypothetical protein
MITTIPSVAQQYELFTELRLQGASLVGGKPIFQAYFPVGKDSLHAGRAVIIGLQLCSLHFALKFKLAK